MHLIGADQAGNHHCQWSGRGWRLAIEPSKTDRGVVRLTINDGGNLVDADMGLADLQVLHQALGRHIHGLGQGDNSRVALESDELQAPTWVLAAKWLLGRVRGGE